MMGSVCRCGRIIDRGERARLCSWCAKPRAGNPSSRLCPECGEPFKGRTKKYCSPFCRISRNNKDKISRAGSKIVKEKRCSKCMQMLPAWHFNIDTTKVDGLSSSGCRRCQARRHAEWRANNRDKIRSADLRKYGITTNQYEKLLAEQGGTCFLCKKPPAGRRLAVDHDHDTGLVRSLLCSYCNKILVGNLTAETARKIANYLESPPAVGIIGSNFAPKPTTKKRGKRRRNA